jgi:hypothetical protein
MWITPREQWIKAVNGVLLELIDYKWDEFKK